MDPSENGTRENAANQNGANQDGIPLRGERRPPRAAVVVNVNDNDGARYMTSLMLQRAGFEVLDASTGAEALALADRLPDVMVLDVRLPDVDGIEVCRRIRANPKTSRIKVLHTSATFVTLEKKIEGLEGGADGYMAQPFEAPELVATVQSLARLSAAEHDLQDRADELVEAGRRKDEFLAMLAHELRNPLSAISAALPLLCQRDPLNEKEVRARGIIDRQISNLSRLVDDLLDVARVTRGKIDLHRAPVNLSELLRRVVAMNRQTRILPKNQSISLALPEKAVYVDADPTRLEQIFSNLLDNASKYTDAGGAIHVSVSPLRTGHDGMVRVQIRDNGIGIAPEVLPTVFDLFSQAAVSIDRSRGGLGIGLTLVKTLVELHGGRIVVASDGLGEGTRFDVELPLLPYDAPIDAVAEARDEAPPPSPSRRILLVEDNADAREGLADLCETWGHAVSTAGDGLEAVRRALDECPEIAFVDIGLPELDGYEVARRIRKEPRGQKLLLVALTGYGAPEQRARALESGFDLHLVKPVEPKKIRTILGDLDALRRNAHRTARTDS